MLVTELLDRAGAYYRLEKKACLANFNFQRKRLDEFFSGRQAEELTAYDFDQLRLWLTEEHKLKPSTVNVYLGYLSCGYRQAARYGEIRSVPSLPFFRVGATNARQDFFELADVAPLLKQLARDPALQALVECALFSGMRKSEIVWLTWGEVRPDGVYLPAHRTKSRKPRKIPMNRRLQAVFRERRRYALSGVDLVFHRFGGEPLKHFYRAYRNACARIGKEGMTFHGCRRSFARWLVRSGTPVDTVLKICGWSSAQMLTRYNIVSDEDLNDASGRIDECSGPRPVLIPDAHPLDLEAV